MVEKIITIAGVARSGTSWIGQVFDSSFETVFRFQPLFSYTFKNRIHHDSTKKNYQELFESMIESEDEFLTQNDKRKSGLYPNFKKSGNANILVFKENRFQYFLTKMISLFPNLKFFGVIRNPNAVINSWVKNPKEFPPGSDINKEWRFGECKNKGLESEFFGFYKWREVSNLYLDLKDKFPNQVYIIRYEDLVNDPMKETKLIFDFAEIELREQTVNFIKDSTSQNIESPYAVYKIKEITERWKMELPQNITAEIALELKGSRLEKYIS